MLHLSRPIQEVLMQRGIEDPATYLQPSAWGDLPSPHSLDGMAEAVQLIQCAIRDRRRVGVFGDHDCDGALSSAILAATLRRLGAAQSSTCLIVTRDTASTTRRSTVSHGPRLISSS